MFVIIQARLSSVRLPGKVLMDLGGQPMLAWVLARVLAARMVTNVAVATSIEPRDNAVADFCKAHNVSCHRGPLDNVAERYAMIARAEGAYGFVRITGDAPLIDPVLIDTAIRLFQAGTWDLVTNVLEAPPRLMRTFPKGQSVEVLRTDTFLKVYAEMDEAADREHVTRFYYRHPERFRLVAFTSGTAAGGVQLSVDTLEDFAFAQSLIAKTKGRLAPWRELSTLKKDMQ
jgi:spore coat polysaccharide biosynthesis protein SpsF